MKQLRLYILLTLIISKITAQEKPLLTESDLAKHTYYFEISENKMIGDGAKFLKEEFKLNQFVLLGEYHNSFQISKLTKVFIPVLDSVGYRNFGLEIGPVSVEILKELTKDSAKTTNDINGFNSKYLVPLKTRTFAPIPFFGNVEDAEFLKEATTRKWNLIGIDQEFLASYIPLLDRIYSNLSKTTKKELTELHSKAVEAVKNAYATDKSGGKQLYETIDESKDYKEFLSLASNKNSTNKKIAEALLKTTSIYLKSVKRKYLEQNKERVAYMKQNLAESFAATKFNLKNDKLFFKMGAVHCGRGFSPLSLFEIGNTLSELAEYNGNKSLHININARHYIDNGKEIDDLADTTGFGYRFKALFQMSKKDKWTVIDLRPLRYTVFYARQYKLDEIIWDIFKGYDLYIMPPTDIDPTPNYKIK